MRVFSAGAPVNVRVEGNTTPVNEQRVAAAQTHALARAIMSPAQQERLARDLEMNLATTVEGVGRFRFNIYRQRGDVVIVVRHVKSDIPSLVELGMPGCCRA